MDPVKGVKKNGKLNKSKRPSEQWISKEVCKDLEDLVLKVEAMEKPQGIVQKEKSYKGDLEVLLKGKGLVNMDEVKEV